MIKGDKLGEGTYGIVYDVINNNVNYALKRNIAENNSSFMNAIRELNILYLLKSHPNIVNLEGLIFNDVTEKNNFSPLLGEDRELQRDDNVHFMFDKGLYDLHDYIYNNKTKEIFQHVKKYMVDCLLAIEFMHHHNIIHRDLKPSNVLIYENYVAKICDFGFSKPYTKQENQTPGIITLSYRAPEILLSSPNYDFKVDIWSMGCLFYEMVTKQPLVEEIEDDNEKLLKNILRVIPVSLSKQEFTAWIVNNTNKTFKMRYCKNTNTLDDFKKNMNFTKNKLKLFEKHCNLDDLISLLHNMLKFNPKFRYNAEQCLNHKFFNEYREYIDTSRLNIQPITKDKILYPVCIERKWMAEITNCLYKNKDKLEWYNTRCLFQAIDMFQRYLYTMHFYLKEDKVETNIMGKIHDEFHTNLLFMACIYISIKYFTTIHYSIPFSDLVQEEFLTPECLQMVEEFEGGLIKNCFKYDIYHDTLFEAADCCNDKLDDNMIKNLLYLFTMNNTISDQLPEDVYMYYRAYLNTNNIEELLLPYKNEDLL